MTETLLAVEGLTKRFGGVTAVRRADLTVPRGGLVGLIGPNGAGKSTLVNVVTKHDEPDEGTVRLDGRPIEHLSAYEVARAGLVRTYQHNRLFWEDSVEENLRMAMVARAGFSNGVTYPGSVGTEDERVEALLELLELQDVRHMLPRDVNHVLQRRTEIAQALALCPRVLLLDEPFAGFTLEEALELETALSRCREGGLTMLVIDHNMQVVMKILEYLYVMHHGQIIAEGTPAEVRANETVVQVYLKGSL